MRYSLFLPIFDALADPRVVARLSAEAEEAGWDGVFVWDHVNYREPVVEVADPWITLAAMAMATERLRLGPMITPLPRRRPAKVARETATLDRLSGGRLTLGVGIGGDLSGELTATGEELGDRARAEMLDESLDLLQAAWAGEPVHHRGKHYVIDGVRFRPRPVQPTIPVWVAVRYGNPRPLRRAARYDGVFPVNVDSPDQLAEIVATVGQLRGADGGSVGGLSVGGLPVGGSVGGLPVGGSVGGLPVGGSVGELSVGGSVGGLSVGGSVGGLGGRAGGSVGELGGLADGYDVAIGGAPGTDPAPYAAVGATWWMVSFDWQSTSVDEVRSVLREGPPQ